MDPRQLIFVDETGFEDFARCYGRSPSSYPLPSFASKVKPDKTSVIGVVGFQPIPFDANYTAEKFEQAMEHIILPVTAVFVMDNASIHSNDPKDQILTQKNITLVKLPPYSYDLNPNWFSALRKDLPSNTRILATNQSSDILQHSQNRPTGNRWLKF